MPLVKVRGSSLHIRENCVSCVGSVMEDEDIGRLDRTEMRTVRRMGNVKLKKLPCTVYEVRWVLRVSGMVYKELG